MNGLKTALRTRAGAEGRDRLLVARMDELREVGANLTLRVPGHQPIRVGPHPERALVRVREPHVLAALIRRDHLALAEAYLRGAIEVEGDFLEVMKVTAIAPPDRSRWARAAAALRGVVRRPGAVRRQSLALHYDRPVDFFLPWLERWRSYSHGFYVAEDDPPDRAQARKLQYAIDALGLKAGSRVLDMGCGWGSFLEYAGRQGIRVHGITISEEQHRFVDGLIREQGLPCQVELVDFHAFEPPEPVDGAVFMGTFEHVGSYRFAAAFLARHLRHNARLYADFCSSRTGHYVGAFLARHIWPGAARYVDVPRLIEALIHAGFNIHVLEDDTRSYARTVRDWADAFDAAEPRLREVADEPTIRAFRLYLRASQAFLSDNQTQAYHLVAGRGPGDLEPPAETAPIPAARTQPTAKRSPKRP